VGGVVSKVESTRVVLAPKGAGLYCSFAGWIWVMKTLYFRFKDKVKYHSVILLWHCFCKIAKALATALWQFSFGRTFMTVLSDIAFLALFM
jgi:hypothetical protein